MKWLFLALGAILGTFLRYLISVVLAQPIWLGFPYATLLVNVFGCFLAGLIVVVLEKTGLSELWRLFLLVGFAGALTTFSAFSLETLALLEAQQNLKFFLNIGLNVFLSLLALFLGVWLMRLLLN